MSDTIEREKKEKLNFTQKMTALSQVKDQFEQKIKETVRANARTTRTHASVHAHACLLA